MSRNRIQSKKHLTRSSKSDILNHEGRGADFISNRSDITGWMKICERNVCRRKGMRVHYFPGHMVKNHMTVMTMMHV